MVGNATYIVVYFNKTVVGTCSYTLYTSNIMCSFMGNYEVGGVFSYG